MKSEKFRTNVDVDFVELIITVYVSTVSDFTFTESTSFRTLDRFFL